MRFLSNLIHANFSIVTGIPVIHSVGASRKRPDGSLMLATYGDR